MAGIGAVLLSFAATGTAWAATYYVATNGSDSNPGTQAAPFRTIAHGSQKMSGGDTLYIKAGTYNESLTNFKNGNPSAYTRFTAAPGDEGKVIIKPYGDFVAFFSVDTAYVEVSNMVLDGMDVKFQNVKIDHHFDPVFKGAHHIRVLRNDIIGSRNYSGILGGTDCEIIGNRIHNSGDYGIYTGGGGGGGLIEGNIIYDSGGYAIHLYQQYQHVNGWVIRNNVIYGNGKGHWKGKDDRPDVWETAPAVVLARGSSQFYNNIVYNNPHGGVQVAHSATNMFVANNTVYGNGKYGIRLIKPIPGENGGSKDARVINNISYGNSGPQIDDNGINTTLQNNLTTDPKFVNAAAHDFGLQAGSPAIDKGVTLAEVKTDFTGKTRPEGAAYDIGAFEGAGSKKDVLPSTVGGLPVGAGGTGGIGGRSDPLGLGHCGQSHL